VFALTTKTISADLKTIVTPCQLGGRPDCHQCGCVAAAGLEAISRHRLPIGIQTGTIFNSSHALGLQVRKLRGMAAPLSRPSTKMHPNPYVHRNVQVRTDES
jgi:hypothetical protein